MAQILLIGVIHIVLFLMFFTLQKISELRSKKLLGKKEVLLYTTIAFFLPLLGFILIFIVAKRHREDVITDMKS